jgi:hypothetical protein
LASVRVVTFLFIVMMERLHSFFRVGRVGSHLGRRSMSSTATLPIVCWSRRSPPYDIPQDVWSGAQNQRNWKVPGSGEKPWQKQKPPRVPLQRRPQAPEARRARRPDQKSQACLIRKPTYLNMRTQSRHQSSRRRHWSGPAYVPDGQVLPLRGP